MNNIIDCKKIAENFSNYYALKIHSANCKINKRPLLTAILVGEDPASKVYVRNKERACDKVGIESNIIHMPTNSTTEEVIEAIKASKDSDGIIVQRPLPPQIDADLVALSIPVNQDVDGFHPTNLGNLILAPDKCLHKPATPVGVVNILRNCKAFLSGTKVVVLGRSATVGLPLSIMLTAENCNVTVLHSKTQPWVREAYCKDADIIISAVGKENSLDITDINKDRKVFIIDVGINRNEEGYLCGDVNPRVHKMANVMYTPVPGGVGPMTISALLGNTYTAFERNNNLKN